MNQSTSKCKKISLFDLIQRDSRFDKLVCITFTLTILHFGLLDLEHSKFHLRPCGARQVGGTSKEWQELVNSINRLKNFFLQ
jgi:hypothetical protein